MFEKRRKATPWNGFVKLPQQPYCPVCRKPLHPDAWAIVSRMATCNRLECYSHPTAGIARKLILDQPGKYRALVHVIATFWTPSEPDTDLLQFDIEAQHTITG